MRSRINDLVRSNVALMLLCVISIGVLVLILRERGAVDARQAEVAKNIPSHVISSASEEPSTPLPTVSDPDWARLPTPDAFESFMYSGQEDLNETLRCDDAYATVLIYPFSIDYRANHAGYVYNQAFPCAKGGDFEQAISLKDLRLTASTTYYLIHASQGSSGTWYNPY